ncbi:MAG TPA: efflux RND transporter periplasmic adaptor subunit, partial [Adhaeribacter sp.]|nr:efflux RND transporter periplasmic adaptor subunit [Adhaeribacter sp.]
RGQPLILLDNSLLKLQLQTIEVQIEGLEADVNRYTILANADAIQGVQLEKAALGLRSAKVQRATLLEQINKTTIRAPFKGIVTAKLSEEGAFAALGVPLLQITDISNLKFTVNVPENDLSKFQLNQNYPVSADAYPDIPLAGKIAMIGSKANMGSNFPVQFTVSNTPSFQIKSGMFGKVNLKNDAREKGIVISSSSIQGAAGQPQVYLVKNGKAVLQNITTSKKIRNKIVVSEGLKAGDILITNGFINLFDQANVRVN